MAKYKLKLYTKIFDLIVLLITIIFLSFFIVSTNNLIIRGISLFLGLIIWIVIVLIIWKLSKKR
jgi:hypothetical protein